jgi:hypothetical protein
MISGLVLIAALNSIQPAILKDSSRPIYEDKLTQNTLTLSREQYRFIAIREEEINQMFKPQWTPLLGKLGKPDEYGTGIFNPEYPSSGIGFSELNEREPKIRK